MKESIFFPCASASSCHVKAVAAAATRIHSVLLVLVALIWLHSSCPISNGSSFSQVLRCQAICDMGVHPATVAATAMCFHLIQICLELRGQLQLLTAVA